MLTNFFETKCVITLDELGNSVTVWSTKCFKSGVSRIYKSYESVTIDHDPTGTRLLSTDIPQQYSEKDSPDDENFLFGNTGLSFEDLNKKGIVVTSVIKTLIKSRI